MTDVRIHFTGPFFDRRADEFLDEFGRKCVETVAGQGYANVMHNLNASIRHPTPYYETQVTVTENHPHERVVNDRDIIYGPWLEGTGSRNRTTRFKGYASFRRARATLRTQVVRLIRPHFDRLNGQLNGR